MKLAFADAYRYVERSAHDAVSRRRRCSTATTSRRARDSSIPRARRTSGPASRRAAAPFICARPTSSGMMVSLIQSNYMGFGSGVVVPGTGISLQNRGAGFVAAAGPSQRGGRRQAAVPHDHSRLRHARWPPLRRVRRDGRAHPAAGPRADAGAPHRLRDEPAGRARRAAMESATPTVRSTSRRRASRGIARGPRSRSATRWNRCPTPTWTSAQASSSSGPTTATLRRRIRGATGRRPASRSIAGRSGLQHRQRQQFAHLDPLASGLGRCQRRRRASSSPGCAASAPGSCACLRPSTPFPVRSVRARSCAGMPATSVRGGTTNPAFTKAMAATIADSPMTALSLTTAFMPTSALRRTMQPCSTAAWPMWPSSSTIVSVPGKAVHDAGVLDVGAGAHFDAAEVAAQAGARPHVAARPDDHVADQHGGRDGRRRSDRRRA